MPRSSQSISPDVLAERDRKIQTLETTIAEMREFEVMLLNLNRCFIEAVRESNADLMQNFFEITVIIDAVCGIRYEFEKGLLINSKKKDALIFLFQKSQQISMMLKIQEELEPLKRLVAKLHESLSQNTIC